MCSVFQYNILIYRLQVVITYTRQWLGWCVLWIVEFVVLPSKLSWATWFSPRPCKPNVLLLLLLLSSSSHICHAVRRLVDPFRAHVSRSLFKGLPWFPLPVGEYCFINLGNYYYPFRHLYAVYLQLCTWNKPPFYAVQCCSCSVVTVCATCNVVSPMKYVLCFYISTSRSLCSVPNMAVFCSSLITRFPGVLPRYCVGYFAMVPVASVITGNTFALFFLLLLLLHDKDISCHSHFSLVLLLNQRWSPPLTLQASHCSTFRIVCDVPSIAVFCSESIEFFPGTASKFFLKLLVTIPVAPIITGITVHFRFHICCISIHKQLYFNFFSASFCTTFLSISVHFVSFLFLIIISGLFAVTSLSVCTAGFHNTVTSPSLLLLLLHDIDVSCYRTFFLVPLLIQRWSIPLRLQAYCYYYYYY